jgi:hypothetical protein
MTWKFIDVLAVQDGLVQVMFIMGLPAACWPVTHCCAEPYVAGLSACAAVSAIMRCVAACSGLSAVPSSFTSTFVICG